MKNVLILTAGLVCAATLAACSGETAARSVSPLTPGVDTRSTTGNSMLYVARFRTFNGEVTVYPLGHKVPTLRLTDGLENPSRIAFDADGNVYVGNDSTVCEFAPGSKKLVRTLDDGVGPHGDLTTDANGNVYVARAFGIVSQILKYPPGEEQPSLIITKGIKAPAAVVVDASGNVYVGNDGRTSNVRVYAPGAKSPMRTLKGHFIQVTALAFDANGNLYVADRGKQEYGVPSKTAKVLVYPPGSSTASRIIHMGLLGPVALKIDTFGNLYVGNVYVNSEPEAMGYVAVYAPGWSAPTYSTEEVNTYEILLGLDPQNNLYVGSNGNEGSRPKALVTVYPQGSRKSSLRIPLGSRALQGLGVSP